MTACLSLIDFDAADPPPWVETRGASGGAYQYRAPSVMIKDIIDFQQMWHDLPTENQDNLLKDLVPTFLNHECVETDQSQPTLDRTKRKRANLLEAWRHLKSFCDTNEQGAVMNTVHCIQETHKIILSGLVHVDEANGTPAGTFSTGKRHTTDNEGNRHDYPVFETEDKASDAVQLVCDRYNALMVEIKKRGNPCDRMYNLFKCAAWLLFELLSLHPFSDGNGRLCCLLCSYALGVYTPFPSPIYNVYSRTRKDDYKDGIVRARGRDPPHPMELTTLIIEANWFAWKAIFDRNDSYGEVADHEN